MGHPGVAEVVDTVHGHVSAFARRQSAAVIASEACGAALGGEAPRAPRIERTGPPFTPGSRNGRRPSPRRFTAPVAAGAAHPSPTPAPGRNRSASPQAPPASALL